MLCLVFQAMCLRAADFTVKSPDGHLSVTLTSGQELTWRVDRDGACVMAPSSLGLRVREGKRVYHPDFSGAKGTVTSHADKWNTVCYRKAVVDDRYNLLTLKAGRWTVEVRVYDDGAAYRFVSGVRGPLVIEDETACFRFPDAGKAFIPYVNDNRGGERWCYSFESYYDEMPLSAMFADSLAITPLAVSLKGGMKATVMDAGVENYPGMMLLKGEGNSLKAAFAPLPLETEIGGYDRLNLVPVKRAGHIARIDNKKQFAFPWRAVVVTTSDAALLDCDMAWCLAPACRLKDTSWIRPGKVAWDWWNNTNVTGVDFLSGMNTPTYRHYIDFAAANHLEYIIIDEGWSGKESLLADLSPDIALDSLLDYGRRKGVGIILWASWRNLKQHTEEVMRHYAEMGVSGFKVDFFDRDDQEVIQSAYDIAACAARHHLLVDYHGLKPFGIQRAYPNVLNFEGVKGLENSKWEPRTASGPLHDQPRYDVTVPFLRMQAGPMDYTPGAMQNATKDCFFGNNDHPMSQGTRVHQMAMYVIFEAPLQMLADSPTKYMREQECTDFIAAVPTVFDETVVIGGEMGEYVILARRKGSTWYLGAMTSWTARDVEIPLGMLPAGEHRAVMFQDGVNAAKEATDYRRTERTVTAGDTLRVRLAPGGGWVMRVG